MGTTGCPTFMETGVARGFGTGNIKITINNNHG
jgi:hypothetical protein